MRSRASVAKLFLLFTLALPAAHGRAVVIWNSSVNGPLSGLGSAPTPFTLAAGTDSVISTVGGTNHQNWLVINIPSGLELNGLILASYSSTDPQGFTGVQRGTTFVGSINDPSVYLGYTHFGTAATNNSLPTVDLVGTDVLPLMGDNRSDGVAPISQGFKPPLPSGNYVFFIQQGGATTNYQYDFVVGPGPVPEPAALSLLAAAMPLCLRRSRGRANTTEQD
ncbi:MAG: hypothetical protein JWN24_3869 [Phycisphaerales bacterium]|nr:hypothetical protein [Phycisphaerales bacterium]